MQILQPLSFSVGFCLQVFYLKDDALHICSFSVWNCIMKIGRTFCIVEMGKKLGSFLWKQLKLCFYLQIIQRKPIIFQILTAIFVCHSNQILFQFLWPMYDTFEVIYKHRKKRHCIQGLVLLLDLFSITTKAGTNSYCCLLHGSVFLFHDQDTLPELSSGETMHPGWGFLFQVLQKCIH